MWKLIEKQNLKYFQLTFDNKLCLHSTKLKTEEFLKRFSPIMLKQIHSDIILDIDSENDGVGDGLVTSANKSIGVKIADCLPVYIFNDKKMAILHCGWRSIIKGILKNVKEIFKDYRYVLGACIGPCCYEIKFDVASLYHLKYQDSIIYRNNKIFLDLKKAVIIALGESNLLADLNYCTYCNSEYFFSHRRGDKEKNYAVLIKV